MSINHEISSSTNNGLLQVQQSEDNHLARIPQVIQNMNGSLESNSSVPQSLNISVISSSLNLNSEENKNLATSVSNSQNPSEGLIPQNAHEDPFEELIQLWTSGNVANMSLGSHNCMQLDYKNYVIEYLSSMTEEMKRLDKDRSSFSDHLVQIKEIHDDIIPKMELKIQTLKNHFKADFQTLENAGVPKEVLEELSKSVKGEIQKIREALTRQMETLTEKAFTHFYINTFNAYPQFHPHLNGFKLEKQLRYLSTDISDFRDQNNVDEKCKEALLDCSFKLQGAAVISEHDTAYESAWIDEKPTKTSQVMKNQIENLKVGESLVFPGTVENHSILYEVIRESKDCYTFTIINTGADEKEWWNRKSFFSKWSSNSKDYYAHKSYSVSASALDTKFLEMITPGKTTDKPTSVLIGELDQALLKRGGKTQFGRMHKPQKRGNCSAKAPASWLKGELMRKLGPEKGKALYLKFKLFRAQKNYKNLLQLADEVPQELVAKAYSNRTYEKPFHPGEVPTKVTQEIPATQKELDEAFFSLDTNVTSIFSKWQAKSSAMEKFL
jgi:hypothetical protein